MTLRIREERVLKRFSESTKGARMTREIYAALTYYHANREEIDRELEAETTDSLRPAREFDQPKE